MSDQEYVRRIINLEAEVARLRDALVRAEATTNAAMARAYEAERRAATRG